MDVALDHNTHDSSLTGGNLLAKNSSDLGLVLVVLFRVTVAAIDHETSGETLGLKLLLGVLDARSVVVGALLASAQNHEAVRVTHGADDGGDTGLGDGQEVVGVLDGADRVDGDVQSAVCAVLEADGEGQTRGQFTVDLGLGRASTNSTNGQTVGQELRRDGIQHLASNRHALVGQVNEHLTRRAQTLVDLEAVVEIRVVDKALPADSGTRLLEVRAHHNQQLILVFLLQLQKLVAVFEGHGGVVDGAGSDDDKETVLVGVCALDDGNGLLTALHDRLVRGLCQCDLMLQEVGGSQRVVSAD